MNEAPDSHPSAAQERRPAIDYGGPDPPTHPSIILVRLTVVATLLWLFLVSSCFVGVRRAAVPSLVVAGAAALLGTAAVQTTYGGPAELRRRARRSLWVALAPAVLTLALFTLSLSQGHPDREMSRRARCASNLRQIGQGIMMYAGSHGGQFPASFGTLLLHEELTSKVFVCPSSDDERATIGLTTRADADRVDSDPHHCSYVYTGASLSSATVTPRHVLAYEGDRAHRGGGMNVQYGDGTVRWLEKAEADHVVAELNANRNPPR